MDGAFRDRLSAWQDSLLRCLAHMEAVIDFGDDERGEDDVQERNAGNAVLEPLVPRLEALLGEVDAHIASFRQGAMIRNGIMVALIGRPNAGKSSLFNRLARKPVAIVSALPGTTRDTLEVRLDLDGLPCTLIDTAGLSEEHAPRGARIVDRTDAELDSDSDSDLDLELELELELNSGGETDPHLLIEREGMRRAK